MIQLEPVSLPTNNGAVAAVSRDDDYRQRILKSKSKSSESKINDNYFFSCSEKQL